MVTIKIEKFEGPLILLLRLIEKEELDITQVSLVHITDQFIEYVSKITNIDPDEMADFLVVATKLLLIKSRALLPYLYPEEEKELEDLTKQLRMYKEFLEAKKKIEKIINNKKFMFAREFNRRAILSNINLFSPPKRITTVDFKKVFKELLARLKPSEKLEEKKLEPKISIEDKILEIKQMIINRIKISFNRFFTKSNSKTEIIVTFLAMLELIKKREVAVSQKKLFGEILISKE
ncbi:hypothetical protein CO115_02460 [Candidatus Falkowbacteria bacterium CG_4_9_14_3_um_filter_36_9]|uniref:Segregation and condensation protein A n=1 Tax=Candidatus Falkowbacteria bacterium CG02_land_8_20_14_3_00_36_14 TaxID=1974560 RepID=A0A2M7DMH5_9BACT|nr:MAG: hypothetical protein COS18_03545 [Candidatus Falkowbacteria bacterium CG02_land_8_20_14_3_00_36_14]PIX10784.1 MAG: hypothetical protein COZ73_04770 [Candidatus Falkowbacteria bacterium CG_4_8_14_3_um_filter_36_11]PJA11085.1 MAG: hypothetical protein COX67_01655 [Candidatus Falkowbacteria bacterium CG_4_10_14_0_2_um_filter_36_22]PJB19643.1 MAG: hypothetical protein CO115_02460 [Candidatus Falkowbacteria bacterium CG_4_9_14_3_um_filter_36_9]